MGKRPVPGTERPLSVLELNRSAQRLLEQQFPDVAVEGEIGRLTRQASGHVYFVLKDPEAVLDAVIWATQVRMLPIQPTEGSRVVVRGRLTVYPPTGRYQLLVRTLRPAGAGDLRQAFLDLKAKLESEGLTSPNRKRPLPFLPRAVGLVTSPTGAALQDILRTVWNRFPDMRCIVAPAPVQGPSAADLLTQALERLSRFPGVDVVIIGRGGGSYEDLQAFNDEGLARAIAACPVPVVSAVGHEIDVTIADLVADVRAVTPTHGGELVVPERTLVLDRLMGASDRVARATERMLQSERRRLELMGRLPGLRDFPLRVSRYGEQCSELFGRLSRALPTLLQDRRRALETCRRALRGQDPAARIEALRTELRGLQHRGERALEAHVARARARVQPLERALGALNPLAVLNRGFSVTRRAGPNGWEIVRGPEELHPGDVVRTAFAQGGEVVARVEGSVDRTLPEG